MTEQEITVQPESSPEDRPHGCLTAFVVGVIIIIVGVVGFIWLNAVFQTPVAVYGGFAGGYALGLLILFTPIAIFLRQPRFKLWRGVALSLALAGGYAALLGGLQTLDVGLLYIDIPASLPPWIGLAYVGIVVLIGRKGWRLGSSSMLVWLAIATGLLASAAWVIFGVAGTLMETLLGGLEAISLGAISSLLLAAVFAFDKDTPTEHPFWAAFLAGAVLNGLLPGLLAIRGYWIQGVFLFGALGAFSWVAATVLVAGRGGWLAPWAGLVTAYLLPLILTEGLEGDWMLDEMALAWGPALGVAAVTTLGLAVASLATARWLQRAKVQGWVPALGATLVLIVVGGLYLALGQPGLQPDVFFVVLADQADTGEAVSIGNRDERVTMVYNLLTEYALDSQSDIRGFLDGKGVPYTPYYLVNGLEVESYDPFLRGQIARRGDVLRVLDSPHARPLPETATAAIPLLPGGVASPQLTWGVDASDAEVVWENFGVTGQGIIVGEADSGVDWQHPALRDQYLGSEGNHDYTWFDPWEGTPEPIDTGGHGTHTLGTVLGKDGIGMAPDAQWIGCRNLARNLGNPAYYLDCMQFLFAPFPQDGDPLADGDPLRGAHVTNNSWGCPPEEGCDGLTLPIGTQHLRDAGQMMVVSAGNEGPRCGTVTSPAHADSVLSVGAYQQGGEATSFSSRGPVGLDGSGRTKPDVSAPGLEVLSSVPGGGYGYSQGTSMAGPHVTGLIALLWSANPDLLGDIDATEQIVFETADEHVATNTRCGVGTADPNNVYGYGLMDADEAVEHALAAD